MHAFDVLGDPVRRRILELLAEGALSAGQVAETIQAEFGISQPAVSQHLRVLRESGFATWQSAGTKRIYRLHPAGLEEVDVYLDRLRAGWSRHLDALGTEVARGRKQRRTSGVEATDTPRPPA